jgi:large subunit ribosomal protein L20
MKRAKGFWGARSVLYRTAKEAVAHAMKYATIHRRQRKRVFRSLWIVRISAACRELGMPYAQFIRGLKKANIDLNRKSLADIALRDGNGFAQLVNRARTALAGA